MLKHSDLDSPGRIDEAPSRSGMTQISRHLPEIMSIYLSSSLTSNMPLASFGDSAVGSWFVSLGRLLDYSLFDEREQ
ncbi:hypothetical protein Hypma_006457 [Hypsizygus marmoreus]|uniref:Uncharacterized protein n=1 Tax=Hypsizygus marmoreus TaxID=39966 RepID=A0A369K1N0_HYPMA|nr:hypothetical protein Hypma_006457 [Hypsizygus marmoreus]